MSNVDPVCNFCLGNNSLTGTIIAKGNLGYAIEADGKPGNYLIIPYVHALTIQDLPDEWWQEVKSILEHMDKPLDAFNISINIGKNAGQSVGHLHFWIVPRHPDKPSSGIGLWGLMQRVDSL